MYIYISLGPWFLVYYTSLCLSTHKYTKLSSCQVGMAIILAFFTSCASKCVSWQVNVFHFVAASSLAVTHAWWSTSAPDIDSIKLNKSQFIINPNNHRNKTHQCMCTVNLFRQIHPSHLPTQQNHWVCNWIKMWLFTWILCIYFHS